MRCHIGIDPKRVRKTWVLFVLHGGGTFFQFWEKGGIFCPRCKNEGFSRISAPVVLQLPHLWVIAPLLAPGSFFCRGRENAVVLKTGYFSFWDRKAHRGFYRLLYCNAHSRGQKALRSVPLFQSSQIHWWVAVPPGRQVFCFLEFRAFFAFCRECPKMHVVVFARMPFEKTGLFLFCSGADVFDFFFVSEEGRVCGSGSFFRERG